jgi:hypothetical protein
MPGHDGGARAAAGHEGARVTPGHDGGVGAAAGCDGRGGPIIAAELYALLPVTTGSPRVCIRRLALANIATA